MFWSTYSLELSQCAIDINFHCFGGYIHIFSTNNNLHLFVMIINNSLICVTDMFGYSKTSHNTSL